MFFPRDAAEKRASFICRNPRGPKPVRISKDIYRERRARKRDPLLLTGGTGFIGSHLAAEFAKEGIPVWILARPNQQLSAPKRMEQIFAWFQMNLKDLEHVRVVEGSLDQPHLGLDGNQYAELLNRVGEIVHCASNTSFSERKRKEVEAANIQSLQNVLILAAEGRCCYFHHLSTAYVAGKRTGLFPEEIVEPGPFHNVYEESKCRGERMVVEVCTRQGIRCNIYRPSIVYGNSQNGRSTSFRALYYPVRTVQFFKRLYETDLEENGGKRAALMGVRRQTNGILYFPLRLETDENGGVNLIPVNYLVQAFMAIREECLDSDIFHIVNPKPVKISDLIEYTQKLFGITGMRAASAEDFARIPRNALEILFHNYLEAYAPYIRDTRLFDRKKAEAVLRPRGIPCPDFNDEIFFRIMGYAIESAWGAKLFPPGD
jgi:nucleoside-diphosphate-sugar epimerase